MDLQGKVAIVTGASRGYGEGIANVLHSRGAEVWITGRKRYDLNTAAEQCRCRYQH